MMRRGVWVPEGCGCDDEKAREYVQFRSGHGFAALFRGFTDCPWTTGTPVRSGRDYGCQLSSIYALSLCWGDIAAEWTDSQRNAQNLRNFINQWLAETWELATRKARWQEVAERLINKEVKRGIVPFWGSMVTIGVDRQLSENRHPWVVDAWGPGKRCATIAYGECNSLEEIEREVCAVNWTHADGGQPVRAAMVLIDSGSRPLGVYEFCERLQAKGIPALPCKGSSRQLSSDYEVAELGKSSSRPGTHLCHVDTIRSQIWIDRAIYDADRDADGGFAIYGGSFVEHEDFIQQLMNDAPIEKSDAHNNASESWDRIDANVPNDMRDCKRYSYTAMLLATRHGQIMQRQLAPSKPLHVDTPSRIRELRFRR
jgi:phage terminase large subunit GpA-like protein